MGKGYIQGSYGHTPGLGGWPGTRIYGYMAHIRAYTGYPCIQGWPVCRIGVDTGTVQGGPYMYCMVPYMTQYGRIHRIYSHTGVQWVRGSHCMDKGWIQCILGDHCTVQCCMYPYMPIYRAIRARYSIYGHIPVYMGGWPLYRGISTVYPYMSPYGPIYGRIWLYPSTTPIGVDMANPGVTRYGQ